jgi:hypothetical protein
MEFIKFSLGMSVKVSSLLARMFLVFSKAYLEAEFIKICLRFGLAIASYQVDRLKKPTHASS